MVDINVQQQIRKTKVNLVIAMGVMIVGILAAVFLYIQLQEKKQEVEVQNKVVEIQRDSLSKLYMLVSVYKDSLESTLARVNQGFVAKSDTNLANQIDKLLIQSANLSTEPVVAVFNNDRSTRVLSLDYLLKNKINDPATIQEMIRNGKKGIDDVKGTVNVLFYLNANSPQSLQPFSGELLEYLDIVDKQVGRQQAKALSKSIRSKLR